MQDAVAEVLRGRGAHDSGESIAWLASAALHIVLLTVIVLAATSESERPTPRSVQIRLAGGARLPNAPRSATPIAKPAPSSSSAPTPSAPRPAVAKPVAVTPPAPLPPPQKKKSSEGESLFGRSQLEPGKPTAPPSPQPAPLPAGSPVSGGASAIPAVGKAGVSALEGGPFPYDAYIERMVSLVGSRWFRPQSGTETLAELYFVIERNGVVRDVKIEKSSGDATFDRAARRAVIESSPLPPLPLAYGGTYLGVHLTFH